LRANAANTDPLPDEINVTQISALTGMTCHRIHTQTYAGKFPKPVFRGKRGPGDEGRHRWRKIDVFNWMREQEQRRAALKRGLDRLSRELAP
jgi:predicted DNA-binding transcriptional regulator AlpA